ncbi:MAG: hypothetical protein VX026_04935 [Myxococcota bacterium]|nr:hypothetical protein [Myxococcota bacterium]
MIFWALLSCQSSTPSSELIEAVDCTTAYQNSQNQASPQDWAVSLPTHDGQILFIAEHHGQAHQIDQLTDAIALMSDRPGPLWFAAEWLPFTATEKLNELVQKPIWDSQQWWDVVAEKYYIAPLELSNYAEPLKTIMTLNQKRTEPIQILGLAPDCRFQQHQTKGAVTACLSQRERAMESRVRDTFSARSNGMMVISTGYRHAQLAQSNPKGPTPLAMRLAKDYSVQSVLLSGQETDGLSTCKGLFDSFQSDQVLALNVLPHSALNTNCLSPDETHNTIALSVAFTHLWHRPSPWRTGTMRSLESWTAMGEETLRGWSRFRFELLGDMELGPNPQTWKAATESQNTNRSPLIQTTFDCTELPQLTRQHQP